MKGVSIQMKKLSTSFTIGKAGVKGGANVEHNNREFISRNVDISRTVNNITYVRQDVREVYDELFGTVLAEYNAKQTRKDRQIHDYFTHISEGGREEAYYEAIIQFGDSETAAIGSENGELAKKMLDEYMRSFEVRNPRLKVFNAVLHADETSYHLHVNFIPFYTAQKKIGMSKGVSMKSALIEQGFEPKGKYKNQLVMWEDSEHKVMEKILNRHGLLRDIKGANHAHKSVPEYKASQDWRKLPKRKKNLSTLEVYADNLRETRVENGILKVENEKLISERNSPWKSFYYSDAEKQSFVQVKLGELNIPFRESENGFEAQQCYVNDVRKIEKQYKSPPSSQRDIIRNDIDRCAMRARTFEDMLGWLKNSGYSIKTGKYIALKSETGNQFIRMKSLGAHFSEQALRSRIENKMKYESEVESKLKSLNKDSFEYAIYKTAKVYTITFSHGTLPINKRKKLQPFTWNNCVELEELAKLNKLINKGFTFKTFQNNIAYLGKSMTKKEEDISQLKADLKTQKDLYEIACNWYMKGKRNPGDIEILEKHELTADRYKRLENVIAGKESQIAELEKSLSAEQAEAARNSELLALLEKVVNGTYVDSLVAEENERRQAAKIGNGLKSADASMSENIRVGAIAERVVEVIEKRAEKSAEVEQNYTPKLRK